MKKNLVAKNELGIYADGNGVVRADSLVVAKIFEKRRDNVVRDIRNLDCSEEFRLLNFEESSYTNLQGHRQACFNMTRDGFVFLVMGYRGKKAASFKEAYIKRFSIQCKVALTIKEAAEYSNIGINKLESLLRSPRCPFVLHGRKTC